MNKTNKDVLSAVQEAMKRGVALGKAVQAVRQLYGRGPSKAELEALKKTRPTRAELVEAVRAQALLGLSAVKANAAVRKQYGIAIKYTDAHAIVREVRASQAAELKGVRMHGEFKTKARAAVADVMPQLSVELLKEMRKWHGEMSLLRDDVASLRTLVEEALTKPAAQTNGVEEVWVNGPAPEGHQ